MNNNTQNVSEDKKYLFTVSVLHSKTKKHKSIVSTNSQENACAHVYSVREILRVADCENDQIRVHLKIMDMRRGKVSAYSKSIFLIKDLIRILQDFKPSTPESQTVSYING